MATLILNNDFEGSPWKGFTLANRQYVLVSTTNPIPKNINQVTSPDGVGKVLKYILNKTDPVISSSVRAEIQLDGTDAPETSERWYGLRYWLEKYDTDDGAESILQWHDSDGTTPPLSIQIASGRIRIMQSFTSGNIPVDLGSTTIGKWINIVIHVKWSNSANGLLEVWRDGVKMVNKTNVRTNSKGGSYMKIGINKWSWAPGGGSSSATQRIFYIDNFKMGDGTVSYADVDPSSTVVPVPNQAPKVNVGLDVSIQLPTNSISLSATASDPDGNIVSYAWSKVSGNNAVIVTPTSVNTSITNLEAGDYVFRLTVTDNANASSSDDVNVHVEPQPVNQPPVVNAGNDFSVNLPGIAFLYGVTSYDPEGGLLTYEWSKESGDPSIITSPTGSSTTVTNLTEGKHEFFLTVTDNKGVSASDSVWVTAISTPKKYSIKDLTGQVLATFDDFYFEVNYNADSQILATFASGSDGHRISIKK